MATIKEEEEEDVVTTNVAHNPTEKPLREVLIRHELSIANLTSISNATACQIRGLEEWIQTFWLPTIQRKHPGVDVLVQDGSVRITITDPNIMDACPEKSTQEWWEKQLVTTLKKIQVEDLGDLQAANLWACIPQNDHEGRGKDDLSRMQRELGVKVVFLTETKNQHVLLVGPKPKLVKKCLTLRNILAHYHWRLTGKSVGKASLLSGA